MLHTKQLCWYSDVYKSKCWPVSVYEQGCPWRSPQSAWSSHTGYPGRRRTQAGLWGVRPSPLPLVFYKMVRRLPLRSLGEISSPIGYLPVYCSGLMPLVDIKQKDQKEDTLWAFKGELWSWFSRGKEKRTTGLCQSGHSTLWLDLI